MTAGAAARACRCAPCTRWSRPSATTSTGINTGTRGAGTNCRRACTRRAIAARANPRRRRLGNGRGARPGARLTQAPTARRRPADRSDRIAMLFTALTVLGVLVTIVGRLWGIYARKRRAEIHDALDIPPPAPPPVAAAAESEAA